MNTDPSSAFSGNSIPDWQNSLGKVGHFLLNSASNTSTFWDKMPQLYHLLLGFQSFCKIPDILSLHEKPKALGALWTQHGLRWSSAAHGHLITASQQPMVLRLKTHGTPMAIKQLVPATKPTCHRSDDRYLHFCFPSLF